MAVALMVPSVRVLRAAVAVLSVAFPSLPASLVPDESDAQTPVTTAVTKLTTGRTKAATKPEEGVRD